MESNDTLKHYVIGTVLFREGEVGDHAYIIESGIVEISRGFQDDQIILGLLGPGEIVGEMAIVDDAPRSATAIVVADSMLRVIQREQLQERLQQADPVLHLLMRLITARYRSSVSMLTNCSDAQEVGNCIKQKQVSGRAIDKFRMEVELRSAIENGYLSVAYQPIVNLDTECVIGFEALARWKHLHNGFIPPQIFVALAEETDLIRRVDEFVFREAVNAIQLINHDLGAKKNLFIAVNISGRQLANIEYLEKAKDLIKTVGLAPELVNLEITESHIAEGNNAESWIKAAKNYGFRIAIDDFGTGYSNLAQLLSLNVDTVKIDRSFVIQLGEVKGAEKVVQGIIALADVMDLSVIVEGIEKEYQNNLLIELGGVVGQGYFWGSPTSLEEILDYGVFFGGGGSLARS